jgi:hypothetical protein
LREALRRSVVRARTHCPGGSSARTQLVPRRARYVAAGPGGHLTWTCRECDQTVYGPPSARTARRSTARLRCGSRVARRAVIGEVGCRPGAEAARRGAHLHYEGKRGVDVLDCPHTYWDAWGRERFTQTRIVPAGMVEHMPSTCVRSLRPSPNGSRTTTPLQSNGQAPAEAAPLL